MNDNKENYKMKLITNFLNTAYTLKTWLRIHRNPWKNISEIKKNQDKMLRSVVKHAYEHTEFYHRLYKKYEITPDNIKSTEDISKLPIVTKQDLINCSIEKRFSNKYIMKECQEVRTSGSTGTPFKVYLEPHARSYLTALHLRRLLIYGYRPSDTIVIFGPFWAEDHQLVHNIGIKKGILNMINFDNNRLSLGENPVKNISLLKAIKPDIIWCPPSYLHMLAEAYNKLGLKEPKFKILICGAETLDQSTRSFIESTFNVDIFDEYGTVDVASRAIAWQCEHHKGYYINSD